MHLYDLPHNFYGTGTMKRVNFNVRELYVSPATYRKNNDPWIFFFYAIIE